MISEVLGGAVLVSSGLAAGVLFTHAVGVWPALQAMAPGQYVAAHKLVGRAYDPMMPIIVGSSVLADIVLAIVAGEGAARPLFAVSALFLVGVSVVSQTKNVPINRSVKALDENAVPADWADPRRRWGRWNLVRTGFALLAFVGNIAAAMAAA
ncbi:anthrone oxygenase family protein [Actinomadura algeriensis]|uniref:Membrane protein n=1 Tax=Actinomadura algeriensis TaxID=1679523 RepID=A0ABR9JIX8_9ACTN|nr:DUF1772 domain-containing protein [Actinomadura algeriensis]MBE1530513.1 putative membrane protein [Actinomadura algeriensis]